MENAKANECLRIDEGFTIHMALFHCTLFVEFLCFSPSSHVFRPELNCDWLIAFLDDIVMLSLWIYRIALLLYVTQLHPNPQSGS